MKLRYYQNDAINAVVEHIETKTTNPCVVVPTGGGKTPIIANLCKIFVESGYRVLVCAHRKELLEQTAEKLRVWAPNVGVGVVSAGLGRQEYGADVTVAGIQSVYRRVNELTAAGKIDFLLVDEARLIPAQDEKEGGMYRTLIDDLKRVEPALATIGLTATPYRLTSGDVCGPKNILNEICYEVGVAELIGGGFLSNLVSKEPPQNVDFDALKIERGEFKTADVEEKCGSDQEIANAVRNLVAYTKNRASVLVFCFSVAHAQKVAAELERRTGVKNVAVVVGETDKNERRAILERFQGKRSQTTLFGAELPPLKYLVNVDVLTTGFDAPNVDCVALLRPTASPGLYYQMVGRGLRLCPGKENCLILDFGGNMRRFGPIDALKAPKPTRRGQVDKEPKATTCPRCFDVFPLGLDVCPNCRYRVAPPDDAFDCPNCGAEQSGSPRFCSACGFEFPLASRCDEDADFDAAILTSEGPGSGDFGSFGGGGSNASRPEFREKVERVDYIYHPKRGSKPSVMVVYRVESGAKISEFLCFSHSGFARRKAAEWWARRSPIRPIPVSTEQALDVVRTVGVARPVAVRYRPAAKKAGEKTWPELVSVETESPPTATAWPRTDNPLGLTCPTCAATPREKQSFRYLRGATTTRIVCARCGAPVATSSNESFDYYDASDFQNAQILLAKDDDDFADF